MMKQDVTNIIEETVQKVSSMRGSELALLKRQLAHLGGNFIFTADEVQTCFFQVTGMTAAGFEAVVPAVVMSVTIQPKKAEMRDGFLTIEGADIRTGNDVWLLAKNLFPGECSKVSLAIAMTEEQKEEKI